jgi:hypothetical protein
MILPINAIEGGLLIEIVGFIITINGLPAIILISGIDATFCFKGLIYQNSGAKYRDNCS